MQKKCKKVQKIAIFPDFHRFFSIFSIFRRFPSNFNISSSNNNCVLFFFLDYSKTFGKCFHMYEICWFIMYNGLMTTLSVEVPKNEEFESFGHIS